MALATILSSVLSGGVADLVKTVADQIHLSPDAKAELQQKLADNALAVQEVQADLEEKLTDAASANIQSEEKGDDAYTKRARPTFLYICEAVLAFNFIILPLMQLIVKRPLAPLALPDPLYWLFGSAMLGYTGARTWEKFMATPGDSSLSIKTPLGSMAAGQKS